MSHIESSEFDMTVEPTCQGTGSRKRTIEHRWSTGTFASSERSTDYVECEGCDDCEEGQ